MAHFAKVLNGVVVSVITAEPEFFATFVDSSPGQWVQTSYNNNTRKNFAGVGYSYDLERDAFIPPKPFPSWVLDEEARHWNPPVAMPLDGKRYFWNESQVNWVEGT